MELFALGENGRTFLKSVENTVGKGEIARYEQFLLFPQCFQMTSTAHTKKTGLVLERVKHILSLPFPNLFPRTFFVLFFKIFQIRHSDI